jgi:D-sedoheptulose 7-phosphate isomerase
MSYSKQHLDESIEITKAIDFEKVDEIVDLLADVKSTGGRLFVLGVGGSAANAGHAVNDFRKLVVEKSFNLDDDLYLYLKLDNDAQIVINISKEYA